MLSRSGKITCLLVSILLLTTAVHAGAFDTQEEKSLALQMASQIKDPAMRLELKQNVLVGNIDSFDQLECIIIDFIELMEERDRIIKDRIRLVIESSYVSLGYKQARRAMFGDIDNIEGVVQCAYTDKEVVTESIPNHKYMNTEHTFPQRYFNKKEPMRSDIHHLFPTDSKANSQRGSYHFGFVTGNPFWEKDGSVLGRNRFGDVVFTVTPNHRGDTARAMFYFSVRYKYKIDNQEETVLRTWHTNDPVDDYEMMRNDKIEQYQKNRNPFVDDPGLASQIYDF